MRSITIVLLATAALASTAGAQGSYKKDIPDSLAKHAKVTEAAAAATAQARVPKGKIESMELEREKGKLIYSFDIKTEGKSGIDEVNVDATTGKILLFEHESPKAEKKEAAADAKAAKKAEHKKKP